jgi:ligand-binding sensor domain-containing protein
MKKFLYPLIAIWFCLGSTVLSQNPEWIVYNTSNSDLPSNNVNCTVIDEFDNKWIGTFGGGLANFDGTNWSVYNNSNSGLPDNDVGSLAIDGSGNKWIGTYGGLAKFDGTNWTVYNTSNSGLPNNAVTNIAIDGSGNKWIGTVGSIFWTDDSGLAKFDGTNWTVYNNSNSGLPSDYVISLAIDGSGNKWIGTWDGLVKFDGSNWTVYKESNSGLPSNFIRCIEIDKSGNKWISTADGLAVYNEGGVVPVEENQIREIVPNEYLLSQNYPNPFNPTTTIKYSIPKLSFVTIKIYDVLGSEVATLVNEEKPFGTYELNWNAANLPSGVYFYRTQAGNFIDTKKMIFLK